LEKVHEELHEKSEQPYRRIIKRIIYYPGNKLSGFFRISVSIPTV